MQTTCEQIKLVLISNFLNHHQLPLCEEFLDLLDGSFRFVATQPIPEERLRMGYANYNDMYPFVIKAYDGEDEETARAIYDADIVINAGAPALRSVIRRVWSDRLTFVYAERLLKDGDRVLRNPLRLLKYKWLFSRFSRKNLHLLCASSYAASDFSKIGAFPGKKYKWGYFPELPPVMEKNACGPLRKGGSSELSILWAGRLLDWKRPYDAVELARSLYVESIPFNLRIIGNGVEFAGVQEAVKAAGLIGRVEMLGSKGPDEVKSAMAESDVFLFTSDYREGWGAVLNEAMGCGTAVVASHACGSTNFLIRHGVNGLIYPCGCIESLQRQVRLLAIDDDLRIRLGRAARETVHGEWGAHSAASRLLELSDSIVRKRANPFTAGPCSKAYDISNEEAEAAVFDSMKRQD